MIPKIEDIDHLVEKVARPENRSEQEDAFEELADGYAIYTLCDEIVRLREELAEARKDADHE